MMTRRSGPTGTFHTAEGPPSISGGPSFAPAQVSCRSATEDLPFRPTTAADCRGTIVEKDLTRERMLGDAFKLLQSALELLDEAGAPPQIGAHLDLALHQLGSSLMAQHDVVSRIPHGDAQN